MRERKKTAVHGTLEMIPLAWKSNSEQLLSKTLNSRVNIIETRAVLESSSVESSSVGSSREVQSYLINSNQINQI